MVLRICFETTSLGTLPRRDPDMERFADRNQKYSQVFLIFTTVKICFKTEAACTPPANCRMARTKQTARRPAEMTTCPLRGIQKKPVAQASGHARQTKDDTEKRVPKVRRTEDAHGAACGRHRQADEERIRELAVKAYHCLLYTSPSPRDKRQSRMPSSA